MVFIGGASAGLGCLIYAEPSQSAAEMADTRQAEEEEGSWKHDQSSPFWPLKAGLSLGGLGGFRCVMLIVVR
jgi:hypothetical protein